MVKSSVKTEKESKNKAIFEQNNLMDTIIIFKNTYSEFVVLSTAF